MIKIRYRDPNEFSPGLHAEAERRGRCTTVYLLSGLTKRERRAALRRLRLSARMGYCPSLPAPQLALALLKDRIRTGAGQTGAVFRLHPAGSTVPIMVLSGGAIAFLLLSTVSIRVLHKTPGGLAAAGTPPIAAASAIPNPAGSSQGQQGSGLGNQGVVSSPAADIGPGSAGSAVNPAGRVGQGASGNTGSVNPGSTGTGTGGSGTGSTGAGSTGTGTGSGATGSGQSGTSSSGNGGSSESSGSTKSSGGGSSGSSGTSGSGSSSGSSSTGSAAAAATTPASTAATPAATSSSSGSSSSGGGVCLDVGPLGVCLNV
jgi:hypothetical protein